MGYIKSIIRNPIVTQWRGLRTSSKNAPDAGAGAYLQPNGWGLLNILNKAGNILGLFLTPNHPYIWWFVFIKQGNVKWY